MTADLVARLAQEIRRVDGSHSLGAGALAEALVPFIAREAASALRSSGEAVAFVTRAGNLIGGLIWTDAGRNADLPDGTKLYLHPATPASAWRPIAEIRPKHGDPVEFAEHELVALVDVEKVAIGTKLYAPPTSTKGG